MKRLISTALLLITTSSISAGEIAVVVNKSSTLNQLDKREVANIFLAKKSRLANNRKIMPVELHNEDYQKSFYLGISGKTLSQVNSYWTTLIFTGKGRPPKKVSGIDELVDVIQKNPDAISYLPLERITGGMKIVHTFQP